MKTIKTGGPAFPRPASEYTASGTLPDGNDAIREQDGMSLRDYFAAHIATMLLNNRLLNLNGIMKEFTGELVNELQRGGGETLNALDELTNVAFAESARDSYRFADAMLKAREE